MIEEKQSEKEEQTQHGTTETEGKAEKTANNDRSIVSEMLEGYRILRNELFSNNSALEIFTLFLTGVIAISTLLYMISSFRALRSLTQQTNSASGQLEQMIESNRVNREALISVQRAFVFTTEFDATRLTDENGVLDGRIRLVFHWENSGSTPTKNMRTHISERWFDHALPPNFDFSDYPSGPPLHMVVGPKGKNRATPIIVPSSDILAVREHRGHLYLWGWARYRDIFDNTPEHVTSFCYEIIEISGDPKSFQPLNLQTASCQIGNCYDEECKK